VKRDTEQFIQGLAARTRPVRRLHGPWTRSVLWLGLSFVYLTIVGMLWSRSGGALKELYAVEQLAALATGILAAAAAFASVIPGYPRELTFTPLAPLALWLTHVGQTCASDWAASHRLPPIASHWFCLPATVITGLVPAVALVIMLRRGAPLTPKLTIALAALAAAGLGNFAVRFVHPFDASFVVLTWHVIAVLLCVVIVSALGDHLLSWKRLQAGA
jgi:hypothetical protein